ncbi:MAG: Uncharacterised protein [Bacteroidetes bacterium MED-G17]|nr:MAG: Uncharacterised protein [Bacteroidetes bacterium MED-G17]
MNNQKFSTKQIAINFGFLLAGYNVITGLMLFFLDMHYQNNSTVGLVNLAVIAAVIIYGITQFKKFNDGFIKLSEALKTGLGIALISGIVSVIYSIVLITFIDPDFIDKMLEFQKETMLEKNPNMSVENANKMVDMQRKFSGPMITSAFIIIFNLFFGFVISLIGGLIVKKSKPE